jgi:hypothetical protein
VPNEGDQNELQVHEVGQYKEAFQKQPEFCNGFYPNVTFQL